MKAWIVVIQLITGQNVGVEVASETECRDLLVSIAKSQKPTLTTNDGLIVPILRGLRCVSPEERAAKAASS